MTSNALSRTAFAILIGAFANSVSAQQPTTAPIAASSATLNLMPVPRTTSVRPGRLRIDASFRVDLVRHTDARLERAVQRMLPRMERRVGLPLSRHVSHGALPQTATLVIDCAASGNPVQSVSEDESYTLDVGNDAITLRAPTAVGAMHGLETVLQLVDGDSAGFFVPAVSIQDSPRFPWRGLMVDVSRHFEPIAMVERTLDAMAAVKLNVLHWHLSDDQGFRVESRRYPRLQRLGSDSLYYTQKQIHDLVAYARDRGIRVVPEFDIPGHSSSWFVGYPQYASAPGQYHIARTWSRFSPVPVFDPTHEDTYRFIDRFIGEMTTLFPDAYWHIGGDEVNGKQWNASPHIQAFMKSHHLADNAALQA
ncbi:MAG: beta-N-acetylhexosaminidase, partial [Gemmatimonadota bacterium]|nr:beta-N-acetylhexosaminidase [Gemmatimonadota bacterium]